jgi:hypothetical protein
MINRAIPFRPKLEGQFRVRFYNAVSTIKVLHQFVLTF